MVRLIEGWLTSIKKRDMQNAAWWEELIWAESQRQLGQSSGTSIEFTGALPEKDTDQEWASLEIRTLKDAIAAFILKSNASSETELRQRLRNIAYRSGLLPAPSQPSREELPMLRLSWTELTKFVEDCASQPDQQKTRTLGWIPSEHPDEVWTLMLDDDLSVKI